MWFSPGPVLDTPPPVPGRGRGRPYRHGVYEFAGPATLVVVGLWIAYLVPHKLRHRQQLLESRTEDRFSEALRVLAVTGPAGSTRRQRADVARGIRPDCGPTADKRAGLLTARTGTPTAGRDRGGAEVDRPHGIQEGISADAARRIAQLHAAHAAATARRGAAARRRGVLAGTLAALTLITWVVVAATAVPLVAGLVPTVLLAGVVGLGRHAVVQGQEAEAEWHRRIAAATAAQERLPRLGRVGASGRAVRPSTTETQSIARVTESTPARSSRVWSGGREGDTWSPVAVPKPTYTTKAPARRREPAPLGDVEGSTAVRVAPRVERETASPAAAEETAAAPAAATGEPAATAQPTPAATAGPAPTPSAGEPSGSIDLNAVLARRRAAGQ